MRHLDEHARAVAGVGLAAARAAMVEVPQHLDRLLQDVVRFAALDVDDEADAAGLVLEPRIVKTLLCRLPRAATRVALLSAAFVLHDQFPLTIRRRTSLAPAARFPALLHQKVA